jgi:hypothetical protein
MVGDMDDDSNLPPPPPIKFGIGRLVATPGAIAALKRSGQHVSEFLASHMAGDWGEVCEEDRKLNDAAIAHEDDPALRTRVLSAYTTAKGERIWLITEADRSSSCLLLPEEY